MDLATVDTAAGAAAGLGAALARARALDHPVLLSTAHPLPAVPDAVPLIAAARATGTATALFERRDDGVATASFGTAWSTEAHGDGRFARVAEQARRVFAEAVWNGGPAPLAIGAFAFAPTTPAGEWSGFPAARLLVPRLAIVQRGAAASVVLNAIVEPGGDLDHIAHRLSRAMARLREWSASPPATEMGRRYAAIAEPDPARWKRTVDTAIGDIAARRFDKLVLARTCRLSATRPFDCARTVAHLRQTYPSCTTFWLQAGGGDFLGATPELLVRVRGRVVETAAVAGSRPRGTTTEADAALARELLDSDKERREHALVVDALAAALRGLCDEVAHDARPEILRLPNVQHLTTAIRGRLHAGAHVLDVVARLHPTPAVAGYPRAAALAALAEREGLERGWYAGPLGWFDATGDGEFAVGIRSALVRDGEALLYAGSGIVAGSDADAELAETRLKLQPLLAALMEI